MPLWLVVAHVPRGFTRDHILTDSSKSITRGLFNTRSRPEHARKRKIVSAVFSPNNVKMFEINIRDCLMAFTGQWDRLALGGTTLRSAYGDGEGEGGWKGDGDRVWFDCLPWFNYLAFDIIGDLAFGKPFGMIAAGKDAAPVQMSESILTNGSNTGISKDGITEVPAIRVLNRRGEFSALLGLFRPWLRWVHHSSWARQV